MSPYDTTELAKARNRAAAERTLVSWLRICLVLIGAGIACNRIALALKAGPGLGAMRPAQLQHLQWLGLGTVGLGLSLLGLSIFVYSRALRALKRQDYTAQPLRLLDLGLTVAAVLLVSLVILAVMGMGLIWL